MWVQWQYYDQQNFILDTSFWVYTQVSEEGYTWMYQLQYRIRWGPGKNNGTIFPNMETARNDWYITSGIGLNSRYWPSHRKPFVALFLHTCWTTSPLWSIVTALSIGVGPPTIAILQTGKINNFPYACIICCDPNLVKWPIWWGLEDSHSPGFLQTMWEWIIQNFFYPGKRDALWQNVLEKCFDKGIGTMDCTIANSTYCWLQ